MSKSTLYEIKMHAELPIIMTKLKENFILAEHAVSYSAGVKDLFEQQQSPIFYLFDLTQWNVMGFEDLMKASAHAARGKSTNFHHPMNRQTLIVSNDTVISKSAEGLSSDAYDNAKIKVFNSVDDALAFAKEQL